MVFSSIIFIFTFLPVTMILYFLTPHKGRNAVLLLMSLFFYAWGEPVYVFLMILSILLNYVCGLDIERKRQNKKLCKRSLIFTVVINLAILGFFKYCGFVVESLNNILRIDIPYRELSLPVGISFYTFQILSYIIDVYKGKVEVQKNLLSFGLYVTMFPQLIAGPIVQYADIEKQLKNRKVTLTSFGNGTVFFIRGLVKKVLLANTIGAVYKEVSGMQLGSLSVLTAWIGCLAFTFQIYFDFSGYSDMAIGLGRMFGFRFTKNFNYPYISRSVTEFWRRWHISLGSWFREYVYIPLGGNRAGKLRHIRNIMIVWMLTGLWHGASWSFVVWGLYYGVILLVEKFVLGKYLERLPALVGICYNMFFVMTGWVFFFSPNLKYAAGYLKVMFGLGNAAAVDAVGIYLLMSNVILIIILILSATPIVYKTFQGIFSNYQRGWMIVQGITYMVMFVLCIAYLVSETYNPFLYFRF